MESGDLSNLLTILHRAGQIGNYEKTIVTIVTMHDFLGFFAAPGVTIGPA